VPLETATYINQLVVTNPAASDGMKGADDHMRLTKAAIKNTFPNVTGAVTATQGELNTLVGGATTLNDAGVFFKTSGDGFKNSLAGDIDVWIGGQIGATFQRTGGTNFFKVTGQIEATTLKGGGMVPIGAVLIWPSDTLPPSDEGTFAWCNGAQYSKTTYATCYARIGNSVDATYFAVPNYQEVALVGKSGMGGATAPGLLTSIASGVKTVLNSLFGNDTKTIARSDLPNVAPTFTGSAGTVNVSGTFSVPYIINNFQTGTAPNPCSYMGMTTGSVSASGSFTPSGTVQSLNGGVTQTGLSVLQPSRTTNFIIRLA
jgi:hypothetical protein